MKLTTFLFEDSMHLPNIVVARQSNVVKKKLKKNNLPTYPKFFSQVTRTKLFFLGPMTTPFIACHKFDLDLLIKVSRA